MSIFSAMTTMYHDLFAHLTPQDLILTVNQRLAASLRNEYTLHQQRQNNKVWLTPDILPFSSWLNRCWEEKQLSLLLNPAQEQTLWEQIIRESGAGEHLLQITSTAQMAKQAWQLAKQWHINPQLPLFADNEDTAAWQQWAQEFQNVCRTNNWTDTNNVLDQIIDSINQGRFQLKGRIFLVGFDELTPQQQTLLAALKNKNYFYQQIPVSNSIPHVTQISCTDTKTELHTVARWAHTLWQQHPQQLIGIVIPNLPAIRTQVMDVFTDTFVPESKLPGYIAKPLAFNISAGAPLDEYPLIHTALTLLMLTEEITLEKLSGLLRSPYLGYADQEMTARAHLDNVLRAPGIRKVFSQQIIVAAQKNHCPYLAQQLQAARKIEQNPTTALLPSQWAEIFSQRLSCLGWPGERTLDSTEYQLAERWSALLTEFASLDLVTKKITAKTASKQLSKLAAITIFQPESSPAPIQILGVLEASGLSFQHLWIMGLYDQAWPPPANPNPFIPRKLQRKFGLPHASSERELEFCRILTQRLIHSAAQTTISYPQHEEDQRLRPSPLIHDIPSIELLDLNLPDHQSYARAIFASAQTEYFEDIYAPPLHPEEKIAGGTAIFKQQAACPFQAFARFRLGAHHIAYPQTGLSARERGSLLHHALETLWNILENHEQLINQSSEQLQTIIDQTITQTLTAFTKQRPDILKKQFTQLERKRLSHLLSAWLIIEKKRAPFTVVSTEQTQAYTIKNIPLKLKVDRIDRLADGSHLIIDYKTGTATTNAWFGERPDEPQLLLYYLAYHSPVSGLAFAQVSNTTMQFKGINAGDMSNWDQQKEQWQHTLEKLADQFVQGYAKVDPKYSGKTCRLCDLQLLCRVEN